MSKAERAPTFEYTTPKERATSRLYTDRRNAWLRGEGPHPVTLYARQHGLDVVDPVPPQPPYGDCSGPYDRDARA